MSKLPAMPAEVQERLEPLLASGEVVRWAGPSDPDRLASAPGVGPIGHRVYVALAACVMLGGIGFAAHLRTIEPLIATMVGAFLLARAWLLAGRNARERARLRARIHAVTDRRIISISGGTIWVVDAQQLTSVDQLGSGDGWGDVTIGFRLPGEQPDDEEFELTLAGVPDIETAIHAIEQLIAHDAPSCQAGDEPASDAPQGSVLTYATT